MSSRLDAPHLDQILALQLSVAYAGEGAGEPPRLGWWKSDLVDREGGGDLLRRLAPKTAAWAGLVLAREAARRVDAGARQQLPGAKRVWTLFDLGFAVNEQLSDRLAYHRQHQHAPAEVLGSHFQIGPGWSTSGFEALLSKLGAPKVEVGPAGRRVLGGGSSPVEGALLLAAALQPLAAAYPMPFIEVSG